MVSVIRRLGREALAGATGVNPRQGEPAGLLLHR